MVTRRDLLTLAGAGALAGPLAGHAERPFGAVPRLLALPSRLPARAGGARLSTPQLRDCEIDHGERNSRAAALGDRDVLEAERRNAGAHSAERANRRIVRAGRLSRRKGRLREPAQLSHLRRTCTSRPRGRPPFPGVLVQMGHTLNGKAGYQRICQWLARFGYLVLGFDPMGQGERTYYPGPTPYRSRLGADEEHTRPGRQMLLKGDSSMRLQTWDAVRSLDYLAAHPLVDPKRLASTGQSGGGTNTMLLAAVDDRLAAAAVSCGNTENVACADFNPPGSTDDGEQNLVGGGPVGFDRWDLLYPLAPKPLLVLVSDRDFFGTYSPNYISSGTEEFGKLKRVYETLGHADRIAWFGTPLPHGLAYDMRIQIYNWFGRWLKGETQDHRGGARLHHGAGIGALRGAERKRGAVVPQRDALLDEPEANRGEEPRRRSTRCLPWTVPRRRPRPRFPARRSATPASRRSSSQPLPAYGCRPGCSCRNSRRR